MGFTKEKTRKIKRYILEKINNNQKDVAKRTAKSFEISLNTVYRYIHELEKENIIKKKEDIKEYELVYCIIDKQLNIAGLPSRFVIY